MVWRSHRRFTDHAETVVASTSVCAMQDSVVSLCRCDLNGWCLRRQMEKLKKYWARNKE